MSRFLWECDNGANCFAESRLLRFEHVNDVFPGSIGMTDIDGLVEVRGALCIVEFKAPGADLPTGQRILFERFTLQRNTRGNRHNLAILCEGDAPTMTPTRLRAWWQGRGTPWRAADRDELRCMLARWVSRVSG